MDSSTQLDLWRKERMNTNDELPEPIPSVQDENKRAQRLVSQINQLAEYGRDSDTDNE